MTLQSPSQPLAENPDAIVDALLDRELLLVTGKGGVGKSTVAAILARAAASNCKKVLICDF